jgi:WD40 repeat protein
VWDAQTGKVLLTLKGHNSTVAAVAFSPDGRRLATTSDDLVAKIWDAETGAELFALPGGGGLAFSPDGNRLAIGASDGNVTVYDATPLPEKP